MGLARMRCSSSSGAAATANAVLAWLCPTWIGLLPRAHGGQAHGVSASCVHQALQQHAADWRLASGAAGLGLRRLVSTSSNAVMAATGGTRASQQQGAAAAAPSGSSTPSAAPSEADAPPPATAQSPQPTAAAASTKPRITPLQVPQQRVRAAYIPWVYSRHLVPKRHVANRMGFLMEALEREQELASLARKGKGSIEPFRAGDVLEVRMSVPEAGGSEYLFRGVCIARHNKGIRTAFKLLNMYPEAGPVVQHIPLHMPDLLSVKVVGSVPARRSKLYYLAKQEGGPPSFQATPRRLGRPAAAAAGGDAAEAGAGGGKAPGGGKGSAGKQQGGKGVKKA